MWILCQVVASKGKKIGSGCTDRVSDSLRNANTEQHIQISIYKFSVILRRGEKWIHIFGVTLKGVKYAK